MSTKGMLLAESPAGLKETEAVVALFEWQHWRYRREARDDIVLPFTRGCPGLVLCSQDDEPIAYGYQAIVRAMGQTGLWLASRCAELDADIKDEDYRESVGIFAIEKTQERAEFVWRMALSNEEKQRMEGVGIKSLFDFMVFLIGNLDTVGTYPGSRVCEDCHAISVKLCQPGGIPMGLFRRYKRALALQDAEDARKKETGDDE